MHKITKESQKQHQQAKYVCTVQCTRGNAPRQGSIYWKAMERIFQRTFECGEWKGGVCLKIVLKKKKSVNQTAKGLRGGQSSMHEGG